MAGFCYNNKSISLIQTWLEELCLIPLLRTFQYFVIKIPNLFPWSPYSVLICFGLVNVNEPNPPAKLGECCAKSKYTNIFPPFLTKMSKLKKECWVHWKWRWSIKVKSWGILRGWMTNLFFSRGNIWHAWNFLEWFVMPTWKLENANEYWSSWVWKELCTHIGISHWLSHCGRQNFFF